MHVITLSQTGTGSTAAAPVDWHLNPFSIGFGCVVSGTVNYTIQHTFDDVQDANATIHWFDHADVAAKTANADGNYAFPIKAIRLTVNSGTGSVTVTILQSGIHS